MNSNKKFILLGNDDLWCQLSDEEYTEMNVSHLFIEAPKRDYSYFDSHHLKKL